MPNQMNNITKVVSSLISLQGKTVDKLAVLSAATVNQNLVTVDKSNVQLDDYADVFGLSNIGGGYPLEVISYRPDTVNNCSYVTVTKTGTDFHHTDRWPAIYKKTGATTYSQLFTSEKLRAGGWCVIYKSTTINDSNILSSFVMASVADYYTMAKTLQSSTNYRAYVYDLSGITRDAWTGTATASAGIAGWYKTHGTIAAMYASGYVKPEGYVTNSQEEYIPLSSYSIGSSVGQHPCENTDFLNLFNAAGESIATSSQVSALYDELGNRVRFVAEMTIPSGILVSGDTKTKVYHDYYDNAQASGTVVISGTTIASGLYQKQGTQFTPITMENAVESFDLSIFQENSPIYILPTITDYSGVAYQKYLIQKAVGVSSTTPSTTAYIDLTPELDYAVLKLNSILANEGTTVTYSAGSTEDPMLAVVSSKFRPYTSHIGGEYNTAAGYNATVYGNNNNVFGDFSTAFGLDNVVAGAQSMTIGTNNVNTADNAYVFGGSNKINGNDIFIYGIGNKTEGSNAFIVGSRNFANGVDTLALGFSNEIVGDRTFAIGSRLKTPDNITDNGLIGSNLSVSATKALVMGWNGVIPSYEGTFPTTDVAYTLSASQFATAVANGTYVSGGIHNKNSFHLCMGDKVTTNDDQSLNVLSYTKYRWEANNAYFAATPKTSTRSALDPIILIPDHRWEFTGKMYMNYTTASGTVDNYDVTIRNGGMVKTCDPGVVITDATAELDFNAASKFKIKMADTTAYSPNLVNWIDGAEGYLVIYAGTNVSWDSSWCWHGSQPANVTSAATGSFVMVKIMVVDNVIIAETVCEHVVTA